ncbi:leucine--tRNA ligase [soil metagenome]
MEYNFGSIEKKWQERWQQTGAYKISNDSDKPKYYVLDMFPYPSGAGLHVGHPLGYIASDIFARFKRLKGYNVLHPMGYDAFGLPAEQYAIEHGVHPADSTKQNIDNFRSQLDKIGFCFDWDREVKTADASYYKWTQWIFLQLFKSFYNRKHNKAESIDVLVTAFEKEGSKQHPFPNANYQLPNLKGNSFTSEQWNNFDAFTQQSILMEYRLAYCGYGEVNWCEALGTVLANDEVVNGVSERGGYPVVKKKLRQWYLRITEYADRLLEGLERIDFSDAMKEMQSNWIGKSYGAEIEFSVHDNQEKLHVYTTRPDTIFGVDFMVVAPEHELIEKITTGKHKQDVADYIAYVKSRSERERMAEKAISGCFTGAYAVNPLNYREIPIYISEYVLAGYGTGAIMAVPCGDDRDFRFAKHFNINITNILGDKFNGEEANSTYDAELVDSDFLTGMLMREASETVITSLEGWGKGKRKVNYKMRDAAFSRQRYWGEPFPVKWENGIASPLEESELPLELPHVESYKPGPEGEGPLANIPEWTVKNLETNTMPGYAGSSWYFLRYMDPHNDATFCDRKVSDYWGQVDLYIGGTEHAVGHLLYSRMWTKALYDLGYIGHDEPYKKLVNQGMIQGVSQMAYVEKNEYKENEKEEEASRGGSNTIIINGQIASVPEPKLQLYSAEFINDDNRDYYKPFNIPIELVILNSTNSKRNELNIKDAITKYSNRLDAIFISPTGYNYNGFWYVKKESDWIEDTKNIANQIFYTESEVEKMSKSKYNVINPDELISKYGADTFRMYEMFLGPVEQSKPWDTKGIEGVHRFLRKLWRLFYDEMKGKVWNEEKATDAELKVLHKTIKKIEDDTERFSFNTAVSAFMVCVNDLHDLKCYKKEVLESLLILLTPYAPHIAEELWSQLGNTSSILDAGYPKFEGRYLVESSKEYPVSINGKLRTTMNIALDIDTKEVERMVIANEVVQKWLEGKQPKKIIYVKNKMINVVV